MMIKTLRMTTSRILLEEQSQHVIKLRTLIWWVRSNSPRLNATRTCTRHASTSATSLRRKTRHSPVKWCWHWVAPHLFWQGSPRGMPLMGGWLSAVIATNLHPPVAAEAVQRLLLILGCLALDQGALASADTRTR